MTLHVLDLFSGIGGFSLGLERAGPFRTVAFCEQDSYATHVLNRHWPGVPVYPDVRTLGFASLVRDDIPLPDVVCGGFPCQDISLAGLGVGLGGARSGLWCEMLRIVDETRPAWVIAENVSALRSRGLDTCLRGLAALGYDAEWHCIPAAALGAPHRRDRIWIVANANGVARQQGWPDHTAEVPRGWHTDRSGFGSDVPNPDSAGLAQRASVRGYPRQKLQALERNDWWGVEPDVGRVVNGVPDRVHRIRCLGNSLVPQIPEIIGRAILAAIAG